MSSHFYTPNGEWVSGLREARKYNALPSPTTILKLISSPALHIYWQNQLFEACQLTERLPGMLDDEYKEAVIAASEAHAAAARERGTTFHEWTSLLNLSFPNIPEERVPGMEDQCDLVAEWYLANVSEILMQEVMVVGEGYAGRLDCCAVMKDNTVEVIDTKTQHLKGKRRFNHYFSWALQLGAYGGALPRMGMTVNKLRSLVVSSHDPGLFEAYPWPEAPSLYHRLFMGIKEVWCYEHNYFPDMTKMKNTNDVAETNKPVRKTLNEYTT